MAAEPAINEFVSSWIAIILQSNLILLRKKEVARDQQQLVLKAFLDISLHFALQMEAFDLTKHTEHQERRLFTSSPQLPDRSQYQFLQSYNQTLADESQRGSFLAIPDNILLKSGVRTCLPQ